MNLVRRALGWLDGRRRLVAAVLAGWVALVVVGAGGRPPDSARLGVPDLQDVFVGVVLAGAVCGVLLIPFAIGRDGGRRRPRKPAQSARTLLIVLSMLVLWSLLTGPRDTADTQAESGSEQVETADEGGSEGTSGVEERDVAALIVTVLVAVVILVWSHRRLAPALRNLGDEPALAQPQVEAALDRATDHLLTEDRPRAAVLKAYSVLEQTLADCDLARGRSETPSEHLARALAAWPFVADPAVRLGRLYEIARFSAHPISSDDQRTAAEALERARSQLRRETAGRS